MNTAGCSSVSPSPDASCCSSAGSSTASAINACGHANCLSWLIHLNTSTGFRSSRSVGSSKLSLQMLTDTKPVGSQIHHQMSRMAPSQGDLEVWCHIGQDHALPLHTDEDGNNLVGVDGVEAQHDSSFSKSLRDQHVGLGKLDASHHCQSGRAYSPSAQRTSANTWICSSSPTNSGKSTLVLPFDELYGFAHVSQPALGSSFALRNLLKEKSYLILESKKQRLGVVTPEPAHPEVCQNVS